VKKLKLLVVEDETLVAISLQRSLVRLGYAVGEIAATGEQAIQFAREQNPDIILMDIRLLGEMDGIEAARQIGLFLPAPIIFTTGYSDPALKVRAMTLKPIAYLIKPVDARQINAILEPIYGATG